MGAPASLCEEFGEPEPVEFVLIGKEDRPMKYLRGILKLLKYRPTFLVLFR